MRTIFIKCPKSFTKEHSKLGFWDNWYATQELWLSLQRIRRILHRFQKRKVSTTPAVKDLDDNAVFYLKSGIVEKFLSASRLGKFKALTLRTFKRYSVKDNALNIIIKFPINLFFDCQFLHRHRDSVQFWVNRFIAKHSTVHFPFYNVKKSKSNHKSNKTKMSF